MQRLRAYWNDPAGISAMEFALLVPALCALTIGAIQLCIVVYANSSLQFAVDDAARCASVQTTVCTGATATQSHAAANFGFANLSPTFTASSPSCGSQVVGSVTYQINAVLTTISVPMSATSCYPIQD
jgi:Flp pilus assembly protein TadG